MRKWLTLATAIGSEVAATLALKAALDHPAWYALVVTGYVVAFAALAVCLRLGMKIGVVYGIWGAGGVTVTALLSAALYGEPLTALMGVGIALIIAGVLTVELGAQRAARRTEATT
jgi:small multidrug resistance pump